MKPLDITLGDILAAARYCETTAEISLRRDRGSWTVRILGAENKGFGSAEDALTFAGTLVACYRHR